MKERTTPLQTAKCEGATLASNFVTIIEENFQGSLSFGSLNIILKLVLGESFDVNTI